MTTTMMATVSTTRPTIFHDAGQDKERISIQEEKKDQAVDDDGNNFIRKCGKLHHVFREWIGIEFRESGYI